jgi:hypothetical protein
LPALDRYKKTLRVLELGELNDGPREPESTLRLDHRVLEVFSSKRKIQLALELGM